MKVYIRKIAYFYTLEEHSQDKWRKILELFDQLLLFADNAVVRLNRIYAFSKLYGESKAIEEALKIEMPKNKYYFLILGVLYRSIDPGKSRNLFEQACQLTKSEVEKNYIMKKYLEE